MSTLLHSQVADSRQVLERLLLQGIVPFWLSTVDHTDGGFRLDHDRRARVRGGRQRHLVTQARNTWLFARLVRSPFAQPAHRDAALHGLALLRERLWDRQHGGLLWSIGLGARDGAVETDKHLYGQAFAIYALAEVALTAGDADAKAQAIELFALIDQHAHDAEHGGYREAFTRDWSPLPDERVSYLGEPAGLKLINTHLHLLEAFTTLHELTGDIVVGARLLELIDILSRRALHQPQGLCTDRYRRDWQPMTRPSDLQISFGHELERFWLLERAARQIAAPVETIQSGGQRAFDYADRFGFDRWRGGYYQSGPFDRRADRREKVWWVQAECLVAALRLWQVTRDPRHARAYLRTLRWIDRRQADHRRGDWHDTVTRLGFVRGDKAGPWKAGYHSGRAMIECLAMCDEIDQK